MNKYSLGYAICNSIQENKDKIKKLEKQNETLKKKNKQLKEQLYKEKEDYKSRCEKANTYINEEIKKIQQHQYSTGIRRLNKIQNILNGSDEK